MQNFKIHYDGRLSRYETYKPVVKANLRSLGTRLWTNACEFGNLVDDKWPDMWPQR